MDYELYNAFETASRSQQMSPGQTAASVVISIIFCILGIVVFWKIFTKAGEEGWKAIIPIYNIYILVKIADGNGIKFLLFLIPIVNIVYMCMLYIRLAKSFGKSTGFGVGLIFLNVIFLCILAFGDAQYIGPRGIPAAGAPVDYQAPPSEPFNPQV